MFISYFTEQPYYPLPEEELFRHYPGDHPARKLGDAVLLFSNRFFDESHARQLFEDRMTEYRYAEEVGFDAITLKEHHSVPWCLQARTNIVASFVAASTERVMIIQQGHLLPIWDNPVQLAEEIAMIDLMSNGRIVPGIFRGPGQDSLASNSNPAFNRERFVEAHDLLIKTWTTPGPFRWEGNHYQFRVVNPWVLPLQKPHPRIFVLARSTPATVKFAAEHGYPVQYINSTAEKNQAMRDLYDEAAEQAGFVAGPEHRVYNLRITVADTQQEAYRLAQHYLHLKDAEHQWGNPLWSTPTGHSTREETARRSAVKGPKYLPIEEQVKQSLFFAGTPDQVTEQLRIWLEVNRPGCITMWGQEGGMTHAEAMRNIGLFGNEVLPRVKAIADSLKLYSPFELNSPVSLAASRS